MACVGLARREGLDLRRSGDGNERGLIAGFDALAGRDFDPGRQGQCVRVVFPLPNGNAIVLMRPEAHAEGSL